MTLLTNKYYIMYVMSRIQAYMTESRLVEVHMSVTLPATLNVSHLKIWQMEIILFTCYLLALNAYVASRILVYVTEFRIIEVYQ